jgi:ABC-type uncharacterized transport system YnjBCD substrate-binding protein
MLTRRSVVCLALLAPLAAAGRPGAAAGQASDAEWKKVIEAARKEGKVVVYNGAVGTPALPKALAAFEGRYGIRAELPEARASELRERIRTEQAAGKILGDVSHNGSTTTALQLADGTFVPYGILPNAGRPVAPFVADGIRVPVYVIQYDATFKGAPHPNTARLLLDFFLSDESQLAYGNLGFVMTVGGLDGKVSAEARALAQTKLLGTTDPKLQDEMLELARTLYK